MHARRPEGDKLTFGEGKYFVDPEASFEVGDRSPSGTDVPARLLHALPAGPLVKGGRNAAAIPSV